MAMLSLKLDQLFIVLVPALVTEVSAASAVGFPSEPDFVQKILSILSHFVIGMKDPLRANPHT
jgi:hypothetical protein